jgi:hypothetical protein
VDVDGYGQISVDLDGYKQIVGTVATRFQCDYRGISQAELRHWLVVTASFNFKFLTAVERRNGQCGFLPACVMAGWLAVMYCSLICGVPYELFVEGALASTGSCR